MIIVTGAIHAAPDTLGPLLAASLEHCRRSRTEPGCIAHNVHVDCEDPHRLVFLEHWDDEAALKAHFAVPESGAFVSYVRKTAAEPPEMAIYHTQRLML